MLKADVIPQQKEETKKTEKTEENKDNIEDKINNEDKNKWLDNITDNNVSNKSTSSILNKNPQPKKKRGRPPKKKIESNNDTHKLIDLLLIGVGGLFIFNGVTKLNN